MGFAPSTMQLTSTAFAPMGRIPKQYTGEGADISPPLAWRNAPPGTKAFALVVHDPDAPLVVRISGRSADREDGRYCEIRVSDNGQGFAERDAEKIFDLFEQLPGRKATSAGSGVGLAICRRIVEHHGGTIRAEGHPGEGATFVIDLPIERCEGRPDDGAASVVVA